MQSNCNSWVFLCLQSWFFLGFLLFDEFFFLVRYDWIDQSIQSHTLQPIILGKLNGHHPLTYKEALTHEYNMHKKLKVSQFLSFVLCLQFFVMNFGFFCLHIFGIVGFIFWYWFCFAFICSNLMHPHLVLSQQMQCIHLTKKIWHQAQVFNLNCPSLQQLHVFRMLVILLTNQLLHSLPLNKIWKFGILLRGLRLWETWWENMRRALLL